MLAVTVDERVIEEVAVDVFVKLSDGVIDGEEP